MDNQKIGRFIADMRKEKGITQKDLAERLNVTDKAVSKWERGLSYPDITILPSLAEELGVGVGELLSGEKCHQTIENEKAVVDSALDYAESALKSGIRSLRSIFALVFSVSLAAGIAVSAIVDFAVTHRFTWSLYPISSIVFAWLIMYPTVYFGRKGVIGSLVALSAAILPFLWILDVLTGASVLRIGIPCALIALAYLWLVFAASKLFAKRKCLSATVGLILSIPFYIAINAVVSYLVSVSHDNTWNMLAYCCVIAAIAGVLIAVEICKNSK